MRHASQRTGNGLNENMKNTIRVDQSNGSCDRIAKMTKYTVLITIAVETDLILK
jgi:hypothetical protein